jgi:hypothetical protein
MYRRPSVSSSASIASDPHPHRQKPSRIILRRDAPILRSSASVDDNLSSRQSTYSYESGESHNSQIEKLELARHHVQVFGLASPPLVRPTRIVFPSSNHIYHGEGENRSKGERSVGVSDLRRVYSEPQIVDLRRVES